MANRVETTLTQELLPLLQRDRFVTVATVDHETGGPNISAISWVYAPNEKTIRFAIDNRSRVIENVQNNDRLALELIGNESTYSITGRAKVAVNTLEDVPLKLAMVEVIVEEVRDVMFYGSRISAEPKYEKTYDKEAADKLDQQVMEAIK
ncbi:pyridoxamine 5'-phosphate oxidase family protein [Texcoconibacillus texcoconensis]|uniref:Nitroimidazol reductase NimA-like FMN-containing flavoprotein (Pyridoxamine 5'-phosphate oxidase superfamily) n=1 Tax=Texcoconibacillus texcoconensis TaxID=1095777 RepID=A0A840QLH6_9BACI|nr:pyridoxamine 5'-phosphate oxidase family protein [Texcoconibacillus texcoconensis]MBB5172222.1 nitroimidazol reductase NimA-like FMN-containing flavoprotein (pyridoxamine 5'-phosphate oxidase superfamily) [Texcoconibacillus texcoconensis]